MHDLSIQLTSREKNICQTFFIHVSTFKWMNVCEIGRTSFTVIAFTEIMYEFMFVKTLC